MKTVILAGGKGTRISEESHLIPKPMIEIGEMPILWHIMKYYSVFGYNDFVICCGYKGYVIKEFFANYFLHMSNVTFDFTQESNELIVHDRKTEPWRVTLVDTGVNSMTGYRIKAIQDYIPKQEPFMMTYGDGLSNIDLFKLLEQHKMNKKTMTVSAVQPDGRFGKLELNDDNVVCGFEEKPEGDGGWINGGFMVLNYSVFEYLVLDENLVFENTPMKSLAKDEQIYAYKHYGWWKPMDTLRDKMILSDLWRREEAPWKVW